jgi:hypothetical protein
VNRSYITHCVDAESKFSTGWSHGREKLSPETPDLAKGSYYANPLTENFAQSLIQRTNNNGQEQPEHCKKQAAAYPEFYADNVWPESLSLLCHGRMHCSSGSVGGCCLLCAVCCVLCAVCDAYCRQNGVHTNLAQLLTESLNAKGRLLHYFDQSQQDDKEDDNNSETMWCGWHNDHVSRRLSSVERPHGTRKSERAVQKFILFYTSHSYST